MQTNSLPKVFLSRLSDIYDVPTKEGILEAFSHPRIGSFRINTLKGQWSDISKELSSKGIQVTSYDGLSDVFTYDKIHEYALKGTNTYYHGNIYIQGIASLLPVLALSLQKDDTVLDVCAAPGSKTTQMAAIMENRGTIIALEQNQIRYDKLMYNCRLEGVTIVNGIKTDAMKYLLNSKKKGIMFDKILLDAPCSAEGRIQLSNEKTYGFWSLENIQKKSQIQYELLSEAWDSLNTGGTLVYSTCTLAPEENEGVIARLLETQKDAVLSEITSPLSEKSWWREGLTSFEGREYGDDMKKTVRILPTRETEGFFIAKIRKH